MGLSHWPERLLDNLLAFQTHPLANMVKPEAALVDFNFPQIVLCLKCDLGSAGPTALDLDLIGLSARTLRTVDPDNEKEHLDAQFNARNVQACISMSSVGDKDEIYLDSTRPATYSNRVVEMSASDSAFGLSPGSGHQSLRHKSGATSLRFVNSAIKVISSWIDTAKSLHADVAENLTARSTLRLASVSDLPFRPKR